MDARPQATTASHDAVSARPTAFLTLIETPKGAQPEVAHREFRPHRERGFAVDPETALQRRRPNRFQQLIEEYGPVADAHGVYSTTPTLCQLREP